MQSRSAINIRPSSDAAAPPELASAQAWPPLLRSDRVPRLTRSRDLLLTMLAWLACAVVLRRPLVHLVAWLDPSMGERLARIIPIDYSVDTVPYLWFAAGLVVVLIMNGVRRRHFLRSGPAADQDAAPLPSDLQFAAAGIPAHERALWRDARCLRVRQPSDGHFEAEAGDQR